MTLKDWFDKIDYEGGYEEGITKYGLYAHDITEAIPTETRDLIKYAINNLRNAVEILDEIRSEIN